MHVHTASVSGGERDTHAVNVQTAKLKVVKVQKWHILHVHRQLQMALFLLYDIEKS